MELELVGSPRLILLVALCSSPAAALLVAPRAPAPRCSAGGAASPSVAIVTGGSGGIGLATARRLAATGADLVLAYGSNDEAAASARTELESEYGVRVRTVGGDLTQTESREATVAAIFKVVDDELGGNVSTFVHAAGFFYDELLSHHFVGACKDFAVYDAYQSIYPKAFASIAEGCIERMADGQGKLVCVSNPGCNSQQTPRVGYDMPGQGKATMEFLVRMYAARLAARGICVNAISPGYTDTKEWDKARLAMGEGDLEVGRQRLNDRMLSRSPMKRWADPDEIAQSIAFLCSTQSGLITGVTLPVDGGLHLT